MTELNERVEGQTAVLLLRSWQTHPAFEVSTVSKGANPSVEALQLTGTEPMLKPQVFIVDHELVMVS